jgi:hypothetical protein
MDKIQELEKAIAVYQKAAEELRNRSYILALEGLDVSLEKGREMNALILQGEVDGAGAERGILAMVATTMVKLRNVIK